ncbi:MAG TPA: hypothetical protein VK718_00035 [Ferruginibacter sp.]|jgi:hypothetical protein|nr:hypothetical protein [Ferruginibacter sp.]
MEQHKNKLTDLHKESLDRLERYVGSNELLAPTDKQKIQAAKNDWQNAWNNLMEALLILEKIEI